jgi:uncharacterized membrane protein YkgB
MKKPTNNRALVATFDTWAVNFAKRNYLFLARFSLFLIYFWFGFLKAIDISPASPLAEGLTAKTIGADMFGPAFFILAVFECLIGVLFLFPRATKVAVLLMLAHMAMVCSPLVLMPADAWQSLLVPTLEGQYIIKNIALIAVAMTLLAHSGPQRAKTQK